MPSTPKQNKKTTKEKIKYWLARPIAFGTLVLTSAYGVKMLLNSLEEQVATILTVLFILALVYILAED